MTLDDETLKIFCDNKLVRELSDQDIETLSWADKVALILQSKMTFGKSRSQEYTEVQKLLKEPPSRNKLNSFSSFLPSPPAVEVLIVDDSEIDVMWYKRQIRRLNADVRIHHAGNGQEALDKLRKLTPESTLLVFLDINMPILNGFECLKEIRQDPKLNGTIVYMFSSSEGERDLQLAFDLGISGYFVKGKLFDSPTTFPALFASYLETKKSL